MTSDKRLMTNTIIGLVTRHLSLVIIFGIFFAVLFPNQILYK